MADPGPHFENHFCGQNQNCIVSIGDSSKTDIYLYKTLDYYHKSNAYSHHEASFSTYSTTCVQRKVAFLNINGHLVCFFNIISEVASSAAVADDGSE